MANASVDYYIELERGNGAQPSEQMLAALALALRLSRDERDHLFYLAGRRLPASGGPVDHIHPGMLDLLHRLDGTPAQLVTDLRVTLVQNRWAAALLGPSPPPTGWQASLLYRWFTDPASRAIYPAEDHDYHTRAFVADLRAAKARRGGDDSEVTALIADLTARSPEFAEHWTRHDVALLRNGRKRLLHPELGLLEVNCLTLFSEDSAQRLLWFTPAVGTDTVAKLEMLDVVGTGTLR